MERNHEWIGNLRRLTAKYDWYTDSYIAYPTISCFIVALARILGERIWGWFIGRPIIFATFGFIVGVIGAFLYNLVAGGVGGIEMVFEQ